MSTAATPPVTPASAPREARVLLVDDEPGIRRLLRHVLQRMPGLAASVEEAGSAEDALTILGGGRFDLIVTDYRMGVKTGVDLLEVAARDQPHARRVLITAFGEMDIGVDAVNRGRVDGFLRKPWENARFTELVKSLLTEPRPSEGSRSAAGAVGAVDGAAGAGASGAAGAGPAASAAPPQDKGEIQRQIQEVNRAIAQIRVRLGLGSLSPEGYERASEELTRRRAALEMQLYTM